MGKGVENGPVTRGPCRTVCDGDIPLLCGIHGRAAGEFRLVFSIRPSDGFIVYIVIRTGTCLCNHRRHYSVLRVYAYVIYWCFFLFLRFLLKYS